MPTVSRVPVVPAYVADRARVAEGFVGENTAGARGDVVVWLCLCLCLRWWWLLGRSLLLGFGSRNFGFGRSIVVLAGFFAERLLEFLHACVSLRQ